KDVPRKEVPMNVRTILATKGSNVITVRPHQTVREAVRLLAYHNIGALVVVDEASRPVGIISERDIVRAAARHEDRDISVMQVADIMTSNLITGTPQDDVHSVAHTMTERRFRHLPIVEEGRLVGIVSIGDVVKAQRDLYRGEVDTLQTQIMADELQNET
ncbi:MAG: CBS domain-containing protein, partial [Ardenticatenia bacterium]|nr:CBS domain-containing protein [Ardenticatenia bacterium]